MTVVNTSPVKATANLSKNKWVHTQLIIVLIIEIFTVQISGDGYLSTYFRGLTHQVMRRRGITLEVCFAPGHFFAPPARVIWFVGRWATDRPMMSPPETRRENNRLTDRILDTENELSVILLSNLPSFCTWALPSTFLLGSVRML